MVRLADVDVCLNIALLLVRFNGASAITDGATDSAPGDPLGHQNVLISEANHDYYRAACPDYRHYAAFPHRPYSQGPMGLPFQRPSQHCRTFASPLVEKVINDVTLRMEDKDLARIFENAFPNTLDTTVKWHVDGSDQTAGKSKYRHSHKNAGAWEGAQSFIVTGDINAEWLRDSTNQLSQYQGLANKELKLQSLILGAINTQAEFIIESPYCNAFQPPPPSHLPHTANGQEDSVHPVYEPSYVFECKYELDSLASFLALANQFYKNTGSTAFLRPRWYRALQTVMEVLRQQTEPTFDPETGKYRRNEYTFKRRTDVGTETLNLAGIGNPLRGGTGLIRSAFRPSDDATILGFFIPANAMIAVELKRTAEMLVIVGKKDLAKGLLEKAESVEQGIWKYGVVNHKIYGEVFAYEVDGYGSAIMMDDANLPSLLSLPLTGFLTTSNAVYRNTRRMVLEKEGNPYYLQGRSIQGIGGPHSKYFGVQNVWPMSLLVRAMTSEDDVEIMESLHFVRNSSRMGLVHESINANRLTEYTRSWFAWANSVFAQTILDLASRKPHLLFQDSKPYVVEGTSIA